MTATDRRAYVVVPREYADLYFKAAYSILIKNYQKFFVNVALLPSILSLTVFFDKYAILQTIFQPFVTVSIFDVIDRVLRGRNVESNGWKRYFKRDLIETVAPLVFANLVVSIVLFELGKVFEGNLPLRVFLLGLSFTWTLLSIFCIPLMVYQRHSLQASIKMSWDATYDNSRPLLISGLSFAGVLIISTLALFLPLFFFGVPLLYVAAYLNYVTIFKEAKLTPEGVSFAD